MTTKTIDCNWNFSTCFYSSWSIFYPRLKWLSGWQSYPYFVANIVKSSDNATSSTFFPQIYNFSKFVTKLLMQYFVKNPLIVLKIFSATFLWKIWNNYAQNLWIFVLEIFQIVPFIDFLDFEICCFFSNWSSFSAQERQSSNLLFVLNVFPKTKSLLLI